MLLGIVLSARDFAGKTIGNYVGKAPGLCIIKLPCVSSSVSDEADFSALLILARFDFLEVESGDASSQPRCSGSLLPLKLPNEAYDDAHSLFLFEIGYGIPTR